MFDQLEDFPARWSALAPPPVSEAKEFDRYAHWLSQRNDDLAKVVRDLIHTKNAFFFVFWVVDAKILHLTRSLIFAFNSDNALLIALCSRSLLEHAASLSYLFRRTGTLLDALPRANTKEKIAAPLLELQAIYQKLFYGTRFFKKEGLVDAVHVLKLIDNYLEKEFPNAKNAYDYLSDFVHPNFGSNFLVSEGKLGEGVIGPSVGVKKQVVERIATISSGLLQFIFNKGIAFGGFGSTLDDYLGRATSAGTTLNEVFRQRPLKYRGDGFTKESAIIFVTARTHGEHLEMQGRFLAEKKVKVVGDRRNAGLEAGHVLDVYVTEEGELWFRVPLPKHNGVGE